MIGERIKRARLAAGFSQREVAKRSNLSAMAISKFERGEVTPTSGALIRVARALDTHIEFFFRPDRVVMGELRYRKRSSLGKKQLARIEANIMDQVERFLELLSLYPAPPVQAFAIPESLPVGINSLEQVEEVALLLREAWNLGHNPIRSVADVLEEHGIIVLVSDVDQGSKFDGLAAQVDGVPLVAVGRNWPGDRQRFTLAHELGHLVLAGRCGLKLDEETACHRFAGAFLVPKDAVITELGVRRRRIEPRELLQHKHEYGLSMAAWVFRARDAGVIGQPVADILMRTFSKKGWRKQEPGDAYPPERPHLFEQLVMHALAEEMISMSKAAELMSMSQSQFRQRLKLESVDAPAHQ